MPVSKRGMMEVIYCIIVLVGVISSSLSKDIVNRFDKRPEEQANLFEGDIKLTPEQRSLLDEAIDDKDGQRKAISDLTKRWPNAVVPYVITGTGITEKINQAIAHWEEKTCFTFVLRTTETNYVNFINGYECSSYIGQIGGRQEVKIANWCTWGNTAHEIGHAIGFWHEHSRPDRDNYIIVDYDNICCGKENNFQIHNNAATYGIPYDVGSIMHYGENAFSDNGFPTILALDWEDQDKMGQRDGLSDRDIQLAEIMCTQ